MMRILLGLAPCLVICAVAAADTITPTYTEVDGTESGVPTTVNAITQGQPTFGSLTQTNFTPWTGGSSDITALNDNSLSEFSLSLPNSNWTLVANLNTTTSPAGYNVTEIQTISGWNADYVDQNYQLAYSTVSAPSTFIPLGTFSLNNTNPVTNGLVDSPTTLRIDLAGTHGGVIAADVAALQFQFAAAASDYGNSTAYREIQVFATPVPEPSSLVLCGLGAAGLLAVARRRRATA